MCQIHFFLFNALAIASANFLNHKQQNEHPLGYLAHHLAWNTCPIVHGIYIYISHGIFTRVVTSSDHESTNLMKYISNIQTFNANFEISRYSMSLI